MQFTAQQIAGLINATVQGNPETTVSSFNNIEAATKGDLTFMGNAKYSEALLQSEASIILIGKDMVPDQPLKATLLVVNDAYQAFATLLEIYQQMHVQGLKGIEEPAFVSESAKLGENIYIGAFSYVNNRSSVGKNTKIYPGCYLGENVKVGENTILYAGVKIYHDCVIGNNVIIHAGAVIGADGFGFVPDKSGVYKKIPQIGNVIIEDDVEIGANTCVDRATLNSTIIKKGTKIDNLVQLAHNVEVGEHTGIAAQAGISGSTHIGKHNMIAGQVGIAGHLKTPDRFIATAQSGIAKVSDKPGQMVGGSPAFAMRDHLKSSAVYRRLPELEKRIAELEKALGERKNG
ncbi:UDP-3-O-[3-hydroxymyristoyl] glucosamine N-acyltransferase [Arachidicoccus rhizosphaerae]|uniref:UDP-3-O-acylglucosamine N-acyltransferase n=1 Tax=Arachidicoccus rhizosphaerae TaxID=551991 RepID=A0A1H4A7A5_9BACT|nr:UDP-3-O-(3-hydroxymyristoyl)glucosamine N-acyltransferase [Arachidicoccus rhizosphaerae]SEA32013.1 UDP-3-O-[3-hydroxymyristoyl] glucosamine N-acyltransferase [Arachidicoccus rhizosphaerae]